MAINIDFHILLAFRARTWIFLAVPISSIDSFAILGH